MKLQFDNRQLLIGFLHLGLIVVSLSLAYLLRFDFSIPREYIPIFYLALRVAMPVKFAVFVLAGLDRHWPWRFVSIGDLFHLFVANVFASLGLMAAMFVIVGPEFPLSLCCIDFLLSLLLTGGVRLASRFYHEEMRNGRARGGKKILIYGAGIAGMLLVREIRKNRELYDVVGFLDDDFSKRGVVLMGVPVLGAGRDAVGIVEQRKGSRSQIQEIIVAIPSAKGPQMQKILAYCRAAGVPCKTVPGLGELLSGKARGAQIRDIPLNHLLAREPVQLNAGRVRSRISGRAVMVSGAAGSIGSELCRQIARFQPRKLVALDQAESELFKLEMELRKNFAGLDLVAEIGDIREGRRVEEIMFLHSVDSVFHAAAYKHVPLMETHVLEAVTNNVLGTWNMVQAAIHNGVSDFLVISTDKAVNPTSVMGATKRVAELIASAMPKDRAGRATKFVSVRFGNVLGSNGSVVPIFQSQIAAGGPITVTHPEARRYFMTIQEAVQLVLHASTMGKGSEVFILDMGEPICIADLARNLIRLCGFVPDQDIEIQYVGLRPGEKIFEELVTKGENILPTHHNKIKVFCGPSPDFASVERWIAELKRLIPQRDAGVVIAHLKELVPEYQPDGQWSSGVRVEHSVAKGSVG